MIYLLLSITASTLIFIIFRSFNTLKINTLQAIVVNYFTACTCGILNNQTHITLNTIPQQPWFIGAIALSILFIIVFNIMALTAQQNGMSVASVASKMSVVIPILFGYYVYNETLGWLKLIGIFLALIAVYLTASKSKTKAFNNTSLWLPVLLFIGSGAIDATIKYVETTFVAKNGIPIFTASIFFIAGIIGICILSIKTIQKKTTFKLKTVFGGLVLGIVNYYSIYFLLKALQLKNIESSTVFTINNVSIVMLSTLLSLILFKEQLQFKNWIGIVIAIISIILVSLNAL